VKSDLDHHRAASFCPNCDSALGANFCPQCGQPAHLHVPSAREFLHEFIAHYVALEGKLWKSLGLLMFKPGRLTREYIEGRRVPYVEPLRLYLSFSIIFFAIVKFGGYQIAQLDNATRAPTQAEQTATPTQPPLKPERADAADASATAPDQAVASASDDNEVLDDVTKYSPTLGGKLRRFMDLSRAQKEAAFRKAFFSYAPYAIFALMPLFAAYLKLLYLGSGRRYGEHLLFALHTNAFAFLALSLLLVVPSEIPFLGGALFLWLLFYTPVAMRKVYGGGRFVTGLRWITLMSLHLFSMVLTIVIVTGLAAIV
jgi:hypothetical protein